MERPLRKQAPTLASGYPSAGFQSDHAPTPRLQSLGAAAVDPAALELPVEWVRALNALMPFYLLLDEGGQIVACGPSMRKLLVGRVVEGADVDEVFQPVPENGLTPRQAMRLPDGGNLRLRCSLGGGFAARATITPLALGDQSGWLMNVSFGTGATRLLRSGKLEEADFPATDMSAEILSLSAAKSAAMATGLRLNRRLRGAWSAAEKLANTDALTGLQNRRALQDTLCRLRQSPVPFAAVHLDLDHFKQVNDSFGHAAGDFALQHVAGILRQELRSEDTIVRQGGDEFVLILIGSQTRDDLSAMARRLIFQIAQPFEFKGKQRFVTASMGIACSGDSGAVDPDQLLRDADVALYAAKDAGRNGFRFFDP